MKSLRIAALCAFLAGLSPAFAQQADMSRVVAIGGSVTEIIYALGEAERLVARDSTSIYPPEALSLPDVGYMRQLSPEGVLSADPSAIIALEGSGPPEALDVLKKASVPLVTVPESFDREGILEKIRVVGAALGVEEKAAVLADQVEKDVAAAQAAAEAMGGEKRVLFVLSIQGGKVLASGTGTAADGIIEMAGGVNAITGYQGYKQLTDEAIIAARPDVILMMARTGNLAVGDAELLAIPAVTETPAGKAKAILRMDGAYLLGFGPRTAGAVRDLAAALHGTAD